MSSADTLFDAITTPVFAGAAIVLLLSVRQVEGWKSRRNHHAKPDAMRQQGPVKFVTSTRCRNGAAI